MTKQYAQATLPKVGDVRMETPTILDGAFKSEPEKCIVVEVHPANLWYRVRFIKTGFIECYKVPQIGRMSEEG